MIPLGYVTHPCQDQIVCKVTIADVPYFNAPIFLQNKQQIGKIDEIFGTLKDYSVSIQLGEGMKASSFKEKDELYIDPHKLLPIARFMPGGDQRGGRGGRGSFYIFS